MNKLPGDIGPLAQQVSWFLGSWARKKDGAFLRTLLGRDGSGGGLSQQANMGLCVLSHPVV